jgi:sugar-specific transcriptional regulator TrmB
VTQSLTSTIIVPGGRHDGIEDIRTNVPASNVLQGTLRPTAWPVSIFSSTSSCAIDTEEIAALQLLGLTVYEGKSYLTLVKNGALKATELAFLSHVPRSKLYATLRLLKQKGLVHVAPSKPEIFTAVSPSASLIARAEEISDQAASALRIARKLSEQHEVRVAHSDELGLTTEANELWRINGRKHIYRSVGKMLMRAVKSVNYYVTAAGLVRAYKAHAECLENADKRGVAVRLLAQSTKQISSVVKELAAVVRSKRTARPLGLNFVCIDKQELIVMEDSPGDFDIERGKDSATWTTNKLLVEAYETLFESEWKNSLPLR